MKDLLAWFGLKRYPFDKNIKPRDVMDTEPLKECSARFDYIKRQTRPQAEILNGNIRGVSGKIENQRHLPGEYGRNACSRIGTEAGKS